MEMQTLKRKRETMIQTDRLTPEHSMQILASAGIALHITQSFKKQRTNVTDGQTYIRAQYAILRISWYCALHYLIIFIQGVTQITFQKGFKHI